MENTTAKKQNKLLLATIIIILAAAAILIAVTGGANKKEKTSDPKNEVKQTETLPAPDQKSTETSTSANKNTGKLNENENPEKLPDETKENKNVVKEDDGKSTEKETEKTSAEASSGDEEAASVLSETLPIFAPPLDGLVIKDYSDEIPVFSYTMNDYRTHTGLDLACSVGTPILASADGVICEVCDDPMMGVTVSISHSGGAATTYRGLSKESMSIVKVGDSVECGQMIGAAGDTALIESAEEPHLHFEMTVNGEHVDPAEYMKVSFLSDMYEG